MSNKVASSIENFFPVSSRVAKMSASKTMAITALTERLRRSGADIVDMGAGEPDFQTPANIRRAAYEAMEKGATKYTPTTGTARLKEAIADRFATDFGAAYQPKQIIAGAGAKQVIFNAVATLINPGDEVLVAKPYWVTFPEVVIFAGGRPVWVETEANDFQLTAKAVKEAITPRSKLIIINSPSNPTGVVIPPDEFERIVKLCVDRGLWIISDECYCQFVYDPVKPFSAAQLPALLRKRIMIAGSVSKTYAMTGWRLGFGLGPEEWIEAMSCLQSHSTSNPTSISQEAAIEALSGPQESVSEMLAAYRERRDWFVPQLRSLNEIKCSMPDGAFYAFPCVKNILGAGNVMTSEELVTYLLEETGVAATPGDAFGAPGYIRLSYATAMNNLKTAIERMGTAFSKLRAAEPTDWAV